jgi:hypothetical protein
MKQTTIFLFAMLLLMAGVQLKAADDVTFRAVAPEAVVMGQQFRLVYSVNAEGREFRGPDLSEFEVLMGPTQSTNRSIQIINGQSSSVYSLSFTYILMPKKEGTFNLAPATIRINNATYTSNSLVIRVLPPDQTSNPATTQGNAANTGTSSAISNEDVFFQMLASPRSVYEQEEVLVTFKFFTALDATPQVPKFPEFEGFLQREIELNPQWVPEHYNGRNYQTAIIKQSVLYPQHSGKITIGSGKLEVNIRQRTQRRVQSIFDDFFDTYQDVRKDVTTTPVTIDVKPLPSGKPASFNGAVGNFTMKTSINSTNIKANEAVTVTVSFTGSGNIRWIKNPEVVFPNDFETYDPKIDENIRTSAQGTSGTKTFEFMAIPRYAGDFEIPAIQFSYFDPKAGVYKTQSSESFKLHVERGVGGEGAAASPIVSNFSNQESLKYLGQDIRYIKLIAKPRFVLNNEIFFGSFTFLFAYLIITILFVVFLMIYRKQVKENANIALVRTKKANKTAVKRLKKAEKLLNENKKEEFYEEVLRALWGYLSDKLNIPQAHLTKENVVTELAKYGVGEELTIEFTDILHTCEFARYAPGQGSEAMDTLFKQTVNAIGKMENTIRRNN